MALNMSKGLIGLPAMELSIVDVNLRNQDISCRGYDWLGYRPFPKVLIIHRAQSPDSEYGTLAGYFHSSCCPALTDLEVNHRTGKGKRFVRIPGDSPSGWASGPISAPYGDGKAFNDLYPFQINTLGEACEVLGRFAQPGTSSQTEDPVDEPARQWLAQWAASRAHDYGIAWSDFPIIRTEGGRSYLTWHEEYTFGTGKVCPGGTVKAITPEIIERARAIMKAAQLGDSIPAPVIEATANLGPDGQPFAAGLDNGLLTAMFGVIRNPDGSRFSYNPKGTISRAWYVRGKAQGRFPFLYDHFQDATSGREYFVFSDGSYLWTPAKGNPFRWG